MDLRIQKTLENIETVFLRLRSALPLNKIQVNDLCAEARINKSTFYRHYEDIYDLSNTLEDRIVAQIISEFSLYDCLFTDTEAFIKGMYQAVEQHQELLTILFRDRMDVLTEKLGKKLKEKLLPDSYSQEDDIRYSFLISGATHVLLDPKYEMETTIAVLSQLLDRPK